jgi:glycosyltransferase involved in cell wall biosynthesis
MGRPRDAAARRPHDRGVALGRGLLPVAASDRRDPERRRRRAPALARARSERGALGLPSDAPVVGTIGGITAKKGHGALLDAARRIVAKDPDATFVWIGLPIEGAALERRIAEAGLSDRMLLAGYRKNAAELLRAFDVFCLPSLHEGLPLSVLEALAAGVPVVATSVGGVPEALAGGGGVLVPPGDADALATTLLELLGDPGRRARLSAEGSTAAKAFDVRETARRTEALYLETVGGARE